MVMLLAVTLGMGVSFRTGSSTDDARDRFARGSSVGCAPSICGRIRHAIAKSKEQQLQLPHGVALDSDGRILVNDSDNQRVSVFDKDAKFV